MDLTGLYLLTTTLVFILQREASSVSITGPLPGADRSQKTHAPSGPPHRVKRCSCENLKDMECVYFCHIGIVWVNTPGQVVPFGEGLYPVRLRRDTGRCVCAGGGDTECLRFCATRRLQREQEENIGSSPKEPNVAKSREKFDTVPLSNGQRPKVSVQKT
ncbi:endothelin-1 [Paramormyrops kingsleyae]|uniref:endothelin-1 n=1 Tax=Paramormyrops kingsleyae TaxID=1676925 RepID=UPI000CD5DE2E|nr:endothelin-1-like [Paramormyrops kingsleyae]